MRILLGTVAAMFATTAAVAADLPARMPVKAPVVAVETYNWNGFYIGVNGGYSWGRSRSDVAFSNSVSGAPIVPPAGSVTSSSFDLNGGVAGGQIGWNWQSGAWVFGLETDFQWSGEKGSTNFLCATATPLPASGGCFPGATFTPAGAAGTSVSMTQSIEWFGTFRARAGVLVAPSVLFYATGGLAYGSVKTDLAIASFSTATFPATAVAAASSSSNAHVGWTAGAGIEAMFARDWSAKIEYLYMDLGSFSNTVAVAYTPAFGVRASVDSRVTDHIIRAGINYHFSPGPVIARY